MTSEAWSFRVAIHPLFFQTDFFFSLKAIAVHGGVGVFSQEFLSTSGLSSLATLQTSLKLLVKKRVLSRPNGGYAISDLFLREWIRRKM